MYGFLCYSFQPMICISYNKTKIAHTRGVCIYKMIQYFLLHARRKTVILEGVTPIFNTQ